VTDAKTRHMIAYSAAAAGLTGMVISALINPSFTGIAFGAATGAGALYGLLLSVVQVSKLVVMVVSYYTTSMLPPEFFVYQ
jgi:hypothetical protein